MDFATISTAAALLAVLLAWYALLEYEDKRRRKGAGRSKRAPAEDVRGSDLALRPRPGGDVKRRPRAPNGHQTPGRRPSPALTGRLNSFRGSYGLAVTGVLVAYPVVALVDLQFSFPPLILFAAAVAVAFTLAGRGPGLCALLLATTLSDFFFVEPTFVFSMDWQVFRLSLVYLLGGLLSVFISRRLAARTSES